MMKIRADEHAYFKQSLERHRRFITITESGSVIVHGQVMRR